MSWVPLRLPYITGGLARPVLLVLPPAHLTVGGLDDWLLEMDGRLAAARERDGW